MLDLLTAPAPRIGLIASALFLMVGLLTGAWKYFSMMANARREAPFYVNTAHRAALMYSFASLVIAVIAYYSVWADWINVVATVAPISFFSLAVALYVIEGIKDRTDNQLRDTKIPRLATLFMVSLMFAEIGGFSVLLVGFFAALI